MDRVPDYLYNNGFKMARGNLVGYTGCVTPEKFFRILGHLKQYDTVERQVWVRQGDRHPVSCLSGEVKCYQATNRSRQISVLPQIALALREPESRLVVEIASDTRYSQLSYVYTVQLKSGNQLIMTQSTTDGGIVYRIELAITDTAVAVGDIEWMLNVVNDNKFDLWTACNLFRLYTDIFALYSTNDYMAGLINKKISHIDTEYQRQLESASDPAAVERMPVFSKVHTVIMEPVCDLTREMLPTIVRPDSSYCVTDKADGSRTMLSVDRSGAVYTTGFGTMNRLSVTLDRSYGLTLFDGELVDTDAGPIYLIFDCLFYRGRSMLELPLLGPDGDNIRFNRDILSEFCERLNSQKRDSNSIQFRCKYYRYSADLAEFQAICREVYHGDYPYNLDGLIFTHMSMSIPEMIQSRETACFRWKPSEMLSVDVYVRFDTEVGNPLQPVITSQDQTRRVTVRLLARDDTCYSNLVEIDQIRLDLPGGADLPITESGETIYPNSVIEFVKGESGWRAIKTREEKTRLMLIDRANKVKSILAVTAKPIAESEIYNLRHDGVALPPIVREGGAPAPSYFFDNPYKTFIRRHYLINLVNFNNLLKFNVITRNMFYRGKEYLPNYLDIACGRGNDMFIWHNRVALYVGLDLDSDNINTCKTVLAPRFRLNHRYKFVEGDMAKPGLADTVKSQLKRADTRFNVVSLQFAIHYLCDSERRLRSLLNTCADMTHRGGYLIFTSLDGHQVYNVLSSQPSGTVEYHSEQGDLLWRIEQDYPSTQPFENCGQRIKFTMQSLMGLKPSTEYLVNYQFIDRLLTAKGFEKSDSRLFSEVASDQALYEQYAGHLHRECTFKRYSTIDYAALRQAVVGRPYLRQLCGLYRYAVYRKR